jgi:hypothetical protein
VLPLPVLVAPVVLVVPLAVGPAVPAVAAERDNSNDSRGAVLWRLSN